MAILKNRITELDALRGIAALAVVIFHFTHNTQTGIYGFNIGCIGVDMFFVISGFVIFMSIQKITSWKDFVWSRFSRLFPTYWTCLTITTILCIAKLHSIYFTKKSYELTNNILIKYAANLTIFQSYLMTDNIDGSYWTLLVECVFYIGIVFLLIFKFTKRIEVIGMLTVLLSLLCAVDGVFNSLVFKQLLHYVPLIAYFPLFFGGILLYKIKFEGITFYRILGFLLTYLVQTIIFKNGYHNNTYVTYNQYILTLGGIYILFVLFLFNYLGFIINKVTIWLGKISYSLYLIHQYVGMSIVKSGLVKKLQLGITGANIFAFIMVLVIATIINRYIEQPSLKYLRGKKTMAVAAS